MQTSSIASAAALLVALVLVVRRRNQERARRPPPVWAVHPPADDGGGDASRAAVVVTGGAGFVGRYLVTRLVKRGDVRVWVFDVRAPAAADRVAGVTYAVGDIRRADDLAQTLAAAGTVDAVFHVASLLPMITTARETIMAVNVDGTANVIAACRAHGVRKLIYTSSATVVIGLNDVSLMGVNEDQPFPEVFLDSYTESKAKAEALVRAADADKSTELRTCILRPAAVFGEGDSFLCDLFEKGESLFIIGSGESEIDWVYVDSIALGHALAYEHFDKAAGNTYNLGSGRSHKYKTFNGSGTRGAREGQSWWNQPLPQHVPVWLIQCLAWFNQATVAVLAAAPLPIGLTPTSIKFTQRSYLFDISRARKDLGYEPIDGGNIETTIRRIVAGWADKSKQ